MNFSNNTIERSKTQQKSRLENEAAINGASRT